MTAIVSVLAPDGSYVIGAEGRRTEAGNIVTDNAQKVFLFDDGTVRLAYAWTGMTIALGAGDVPLFDVRRACEESLPVAVQTNTDAAGFLNTLMWNLRSRIPACINGLRTAELCRSIFVGFFHGIPFTAELGVGYPSSYLVLTPTLNSPAQPHRSIFSGVENFEAKYAGRQPQTRAEAIAYIMEYLQDCVDSDLPECVGMGGHIHIVEMNDQNSSWVVPPKVS